MATPSIIEQLRISNAEARVTIFTTYLRKSLAEFLEFDGEEEIAINQNFVALGVSSMDAVNFKFQLEKALQCKLKTTLFFDYPTLDVLVHHLLTEVLEFDIVRPKRLVASHNPEKNSTSLYAKNTEEIVLIAIDGSFPKARTPEALWQQSMTPETIAPQPVDASMLSNQFPDSIFTDQLVPLGITKEVFYTLSRKRRMVYTAIGNAIYDSTIPINEFTASKTGVFFVSDGKMENVSPDNPYGVPLANEISFRLNFNGPSETVNTFCTSIYVAIHRALQSIQANECAQALVGGVNIIDKKEFQNLAKQGIYDDLLSNTTLSFSNEANGFVRSEGVGALIVTTLSKALTYHANILCVMKATAVSHGGKNFSMEAPNAMGIKSTITTCIEKSGIAPETIDYIEAHGIANPLADAIELASINDSYTSLSNDPHKKWQISTVKPVVGHPELVSGLASLIKVVKAFENNLVPGIPNLQTLNTEIPVNHRLSIRKDATSWTKTVNPRRAALNSYAIGGVNAHMIIEEYGPKDIRQENTSEVFAKQSDPDLGISSMQETIISQCVSEIFKLELATIAYSRSPMDYGFDSIKIVQFVRRINEKLSIDIKLGEALGVNSFRDFFQLVAAKEPLGSKTPVPFTNELALFDGFSCGVTSFQKGLWLAQESDPSTFTYNLPIVFSVKKSVKTDIVVQTLAFLLEKHPVLRTFFISNNGQVVQKLHPISNCLKVDTKCISTPPISEFKQLLKIPFNLQEDCLLRTYVRTHQHGGHEFLIFIIHHIIMDGLSGAQFMKLFWGTYNTIEKGGKNNLGVINTSFFDFVSDETHYLKTAAGTADLSWWREQLKNTDPLSLPYDYPKNTAIPCQEKNIARLLIKGNDFSRLKEIATSLKVNLSVLLMAGFKILLHKLTQQDDITIATPVEGRQKTSYEESLGCFVNVILIRSKLDPKSTLQHNIEHIKTSFLTSLDHANYPLTELLGKLAEQRTTTTVQTLVSYTYQNIFDAILDGPLADDTITPMYDVYQQTQDEYALEVYDFRDSLQLNFKYKKNLFEAATVQKHLDYLCRIIDQFSENKELLLSDLSVLSEKEKKVFLTHFDATDIAYPEHKTIIDLFEEQVLKTPNHIAVTFNNVQLSYLDLNAKVNKLARYLRKKGVDMKDRVVLCLDRSLDIIISILAVGKAGASYVPIDPSYPIERIQFTIDDVTPKCLICKASISEKLKDSLYTFIDTEKEAPIINKEPSGNMVLPIHPNDTLYIIYTSGTTGKPKGVLISHTNVVRLFMTDKSLFDFNENDVWTLFHSYCFDFSVWELFGALLFGGKLVVVSDEVRKDTQLFSELLIKDKVTVLNQTPSSFYALQENIGHLPEKLDLRYVIFGGEALQPSLVRSWYKKYRRCKLVNMYGITETTVHVTYQEITEQEINDGVSTIGVPMPTLSCYVLDKNKNLLPQGVPGELYIGGKGVAKGYLNRDELTKKRFVASPFKSNTLLYKSGDIVKWNNEYRLEYIGRTDSQVKIRGHRVELNEIKNVLLKDKNIVQCTVITKETRDNNTQLIAYVKLNNSVEKKEIYSFLSGRLPHYMIPDAIYIVAYFKLTSNGKIDTKNLPLPNFDKDKQHYLAPTNRVEKTITTIFQEVLQQEKIGLLDNFFELGGHSLLVTKTVYKINTALLSKLSAHQLFKHPTPKQLALCIEKGAETSIQVDLQKELGPFVDFTSADFVFPTKPQHIFITGGTGFVGAFLLYELLENTTAQLYCLTRGSSIEEAFSKVKNGLLKYDLWSDGYTNRIKIILGDIGAPLLALTPETFDGLSTMIDLIYHNAAHMNHLATYQDLKPANVGGLLEIIKLATKNKIKPLHYTSTLAVFNNTDRQELQVISEKNSSENEIHYEENGYSTSKWVAENIVFQAQKAGLPCTIYRLGLTIGDSIKGRLDNKQWFYEFIKSCITVDAMIDQDLSSKLPMMPVDIVAKSLARLSLKEETLNRTFHLVGKPISLYDIFKKYNTTKNNSPLKELSIYDWLNLVKRNSDLSIPPFLQDYLELSKKELFERKNKELTAKLQFNNAFTEKQLKNNSIAYVQVNDTMIQEYFTYVKKKENLV